jgi:hypothetical protein
MALKGPILEISESENKCYVQTYWTWNPYLYIEQQLKEEQFLHQEQ